MQYNMKRYIPMHEMTPYDFVMHEALQLHSTFRCIHWNIKEDI